MVQWFILTAYNAGGTGSIPCWGTKIPHAMLCGQKIKQNRTTQLKIKKERERRGGNNSEKIQENMVTQKPSKVFLGVINLTDAADRLNTENSQLTGAVRRACMRRSFKRVGE